MAGNASDPKKNPVFEIVLSLGALAGLFAVIEAMLKDETSRVVGIIVISAAALWYLIARRLLDVAQAALSVLVTILSLVIVSILLSQPGTLTGDVIYGNGTPAAGLNLVLMNANGIRQESVTDKEGRFEIRNVPEGFYTIKVNDQLIHSGTMPNALQRLFNPESVGDVVANPSPGSPPIVVVQPSPPAQPNTPVPTTPPAPTDTATATSTASLTPSKTPLPTATPTLAPTQTMTPAPESTRAPGATRVDGKGVTQVWVPAGCFMMGNSSGDADEQPAHSVCFTRGYWIDQNEVTNAAFKAFMDDGGYRKAEYWQLFNAWSWIQLNRGPQDYFGFTDPDRPRVGISWYEAVAYSQWRGCGLPTEANWEYAARGPNSSKYPWGDMWDSLKTNADEPTGKTTSVKSYEGDRSWIGAYDMAGNASEWVEDWYSDTYYRERVVDNPHGPVDGVTRVVRGGSWISAPALARTDYRNPVDPTVRTSTIGFRVTCADS